MIRTQIQLSEAQATKLKQLAATEGKSVAELIRQSVDVMLAAALVPDQEERRRRAMSAAGRFHTSAIDLAEEHDHYLTEAFAE